MKLLLIIAGIVLFIVCVGLTVSLLVSVILIDSAEW